MGEFHVHRVRFFEWTPKSIQCISYSPSSQRVALSRDDGSIELWSLKDSWFQEEVIPGIEDQSIEDLIWQNDRLFSASLEGYIREIDLVKLNVKKCCASNAGPVWCMTSNRAGTRLAAGTEDGCVVLFDTEYNALDYQTRFDSQESRILCISWHPDDNTIVTGGIDNIRIWSVSSGRAVQRLTVARTVKNKETVIWSVKCLSDMTIVSGDSRGKTSFWNGTQGTLIKSIQSHKADVYCLAVDPSETTVVASGIDSSVVEFNFVNIVSKKEKFGVRDWVARLVHNHHTHDVRAIQIINKSVVTGGVDTNLIEFSLNAPGYDKQPRKRSSQNRWRRIYPIPQKSLVRVAGDVSIILLQYTNYLEVWRLGFTERTGHNGDILPLRSSPVKLIQLRTKGGAPIFCSDISKDASLLTYSDCETTKVYSINLEHLDSIQPSVKMKRVTSNVDSVPDGAHCLCLCNDNTRLVSVTASSCVQISSIKEGKVSVQHTFPQLSDSIHLLSVSGDSGLAAVADHRGNVHIYSLTKKQHLCSVPSQENQVSALNFSPDSKMVVMAYTNQKIFEFDILKKEYSAWSKIHSHNFMNVWLRRKSKIINISYNPSNNEQIILHDEQLFCILDKSQKFPQVSSFEELKMEKNTAFHICTKYKYLFHMEILPDNWLIAVERPPLEMTSSLPEALKRKKFGT